MLMGELKNTQEHTKVGVMSLPDPSRIAYDCSTSFYRWYVIVKGKY